MQTFLTNSEFGYAASQLDRMRLGKQRVETWQIYNALINPKYGWQNHPAVNMWRGYLGALLDYQTAICYEWVVNRGYKDTCLEKTEALLHNHPLTDEYPDWLGDSEIHTSHQSNLVKKDPIFYKAVFPNVPDNIEYVWPV